MPEKNKQNEEVESQPIPLCEKCGNAMTNEEDQWFCPHCQGEIDFLGDDDE
jgi:rubrerythrin